MPWPTKIPIATFTNAAENRGCNNAHANKMPNAILNLAKLNACVSLYFL